MYIKSVTVDGFKSYGRRTEISGFDPEFTAITGLNGTGKSNILDSICFVLGISNLGQVRATSLQDLVYKGGQAGVTKATVTLLFDNTDSEQCPLGYEKCREISVTRQVVVGGKNKYLINGKIVQNKKVSDLFCSVQLNVNNPNFLIMQGRITKVLNMKPAEILSMIEEAAGTSMYESKKDASTKLIEKKDAKVREANTILVQEVEPRLEKLRKEHAAYLEFQKISRDIEHLTRIHISFKYLKNKEALTETEKNIEKLSKHIESNKNKIIENDEEIKNCEERVQEIQHKIDTESGGELKELEELLSNKLKEESKTSGLTRSTQVSIEHEEKKIETLTLSIKDDEETLVKKESNMQKVQDLFESLKTADENDAKAYVAAQRKFEAVTQGLSTNEDGEASSLQDQLITAKQHISEAKTTIKTSEMELKHSQTILRQKENETQVSDAAYLRDKTKSDQIENEITKLNNLISTVSYEDGSLEELEQSRALLLQEIRTLKQQLDRRNASRYELQYKDPEPGFDRSKVRGMVGKLFKVQNERDCLALTMTAGGGLYSYVTDDDITSKKILQKGQLQQRVTIIPINKITSYPIDRSVVRTAQNLVGRENVDSALNLIEYNPIFDPVMKYVFGRTLICKDMNIAKQVTFHKNILCRSVTLEGDIVDPEGTLSGGSAPRGSNILQDLAEIIRIEENIKNKEEELRNIQEKIGQLQDVAKYYNDIKANLDLRQHELEACKQRLAQTAFQQNQKEIEDLRQKIVTLERDLVDARAKQESANNKVRNLQTKLTDAKGYHERELKAASEEMIVAKKKSEASRANWKKREQEYETLQLEIEEIRKGTENSEIEREKLRDNLNTLKVQINELQRDGRVFKNELNEIKSKITQQKDKIRSQNHELKSNLDKKNKLSKQTQEILLDIKKKENEVNKVKNESKDGFSKIEDLENKYGWIKEDCEFFGAKNTRYDYSKEDPYEAGRKLAKAKETKAKMELNLNIKAMTLLDREEQQYQITIKRKKVLDEDKQKLNDIICRMDEKKKEKIENAWTHVNENFSGIFSLLLPGAQAELRPSFNRQTLIGLEIRVGFNGIWKDSLGELSGGQRSLVALSLVLAMLKFSPAPLYILDEVDAALDMSHTQNIGNMFKTYFTNSQFIIVSLKDGMFNNANVLFKTRFEEGVSAVSRTDNRRHRN